MVINVTRVYLNIGRHTNTSQIKTFSKKLRTYVDILRLNPAILILAAMARIREDWFRHGQKIQATEYSHGLTLLLVISNSFLLSKEPCNYHNQTATAAAFYSFSSTDQSRVAALNSVTPRTIRHMVDKGNEESQLVVFPGDDYCAGGQLCDEVKGDQEILESIRTQLFKISGRSRSSKQQVSSPDHEQTYLYLDQSIAGWHNRHGADLDLLTPGKTNRLLESETFSGEGLDVILS
ncbi:hypothetical protein RRG08_028665 [Elysia crispata]|uniref:Uncharacterized protein n=1 Tax=Elysia crispata TaxID=231223 RepID=A0AAE1DDK6_9GAST|nr:hypothetical protein RRG08_028665 [Elysia crispata]